MEMCRNNAAEHLAQSVGRTGKETSALDELTRLLGLEQPPVFIESYDISNLAGGENVAGMVVFENGKPLKSAYRKFQIKTVAGQDDYGSMREVIRRRFGEYFSRKEKGETEGLPSFRISFCSTAAKAMWRQSGRYWNPWGFRSRCSAW